MNGALKWKLAAGFVLVFIAGAMTGASLLAHFHEALFWSHHHGALAHRMAEHLRDELDLTPQQFAKLQPVIQRTTEKLQEIRKETGQRVGEVMGEAHQQIASELNPEQLKKLNTLEERHRRHLHHHGFREPPDHEAPPP